MVEETSTISPAVEETSTETPIQIANQAADNAELGFAQFIGKDGELKEGWKKGIVPEGLREEKSLDVYTNIGDVFKSNVETKRMLGKKGIILPGENATEEEIGEFHKALGRPDTPELYEIKRPDSIPEDNWFPERVAQAQQLFHKLGLNPTQANAIAEMDNLRVAGEIKAKQDAQAVAEQTIRDVAGIKYEQMFHDTKLMLNEILPTLPEQVRDDVTSAMNEAENRPFMFFLLSKVQEKYAEGSVLAGGEIGGQGSLQAKIDEEMTKTNPTTGKVIYIDPQDPGHERQKLLVNSLFSQKAALTGPQA